MNSATLLFRQINPNWIQEGRVSSQAFRPMPKDKTLLSAYDGDLISAENAWLHFTAKLGFSSLGVQAVGVHECAELGLPTRSDPAEFPEHAVIDFEGLSNNAAEKNRRLCATLQKLAAGYSNRINGTRSSYLLS